MNPKFPNIKRFGREQVERPCRGGVRFLAASDGVLAAQV